jgi:hypothetical protein
VGKALVTRGPVVAQQREIAPMEMGPVEVEPMEVGLVEVGRTEAGQLVAGQAQAARIVRLATPYPLSLRKSCHHGCLLPQLFRDPKRQIGSRESASLAGSASDGFASHSWLRGQPWPQ